MKFSVAYYTFIAAIVALLATVGCLEHADQQLHQLHRHECLTHGYSDVQYAAGRTFCVGVLNGTTITKDIGPQ